MTETIECVRCGKEFESMTARTMHTIRKRCPEINSDEDVESADMAHGIDEAISMVDDND